MDVTPFIPSDRQVIDGYRAGEFQVSQVVYQGPILVFPGHTVPWDVVGFAGLMAESFAPVKVVVPPVELLLLGSGSKMQLLPSRLRQELRAAGIVVEVMDTGAACRTYNILLSEDRRVAAALLPV
ncbi:MAG TPA: Mth938-like domain-containing protein [Azospirillaceae bacterium]|nr:Mth938-like domain-containing protein [Azospirillaceae bacterium]